MHGDKTDASFKAVIYLASVVIQFQQFSTGLSQTWRVCYEYRSEMPPFMRSDAPGAAQAAGRGQERRLASAKRKGAAAGSR